MCRCRVPVGRLLSDSIPLNALLGNDNTAARLKTFKQCFSCFWLLVMLNDHCWYTAHHNVTTLQGLFTFPPGLKTISIGLC